MVKKFVVSLVLAMACFLTAWADDIRPQSEVVTVLNGKNADGICVAEYENGFPVLKFKFSYPADIDTIKYLGMYTGNPKGVEGYMPLNLSTENGQKNNREYFGNFTKFVFNGDSVDIYPYAECVYKNEGKGAFELNLRVVHYRRPFFIAPNTIIKCVIPSLCAFELAPGKPNILRKFQSAEYEFVVGDKGDELVSGVKFSSELAGDKNDILLDNGAILVVDKDFSCKSIIVKAGDEENDWRGAGIVINKGATLSADTVYYLANDHDDRSLGYLVNNGTYNAGSVFFKNSLYESKLMWTYARSYGYVYGNGNVMPKWKFHFPAFCTPVQKIDGWIDVVYGGIKSVNFANFLAAGLFCDYNEKESHMAYDWSDYFSLEKQYPFYLYNEFTQPISVRVPGAVNDDDSYTLQVKNIAEDGKPSKTFVNNPYPAPIDWRSVMESAITADGDSSFVNAIRDVQVSFVAHSIFSMYNLKTGITTFDAPNKMYYGYLQPNMSHSSLVHQNGERAEVTFSKNDLCSYAMADEKYADADLTNGLPYVRLYVDDVVDTLSKGEGLRGVVALYFVPEQLNDSLHSAKCPDYDSNYDVNNVWETLSGWCFDPSSWSSGQVFPYIGAYGEKQQYADKATAIKMVAIPADTSKTTKQYVLTESRLSDFIRISIEQKKAKGGVSFGVLDGNLKDFGLGIRVGGLSYNYPELPDVITSSIDVEEGLADGETQKRFEAGKKFSDWDCKQISLDLSVARQYRTSTALDIVKKSASVVIKGGVGEVTLKASESGTLTLYDLSGRIVSETSMSSGSVSIGRGVYLASFKSVDGVSSAHVIVK